MTNEKKNQVAAMNASGMSVDEIVLNTKLDKQTVTDFVEERNRRNAIRELNEQGKTTVEIAEILKLSPKTVGHIIGGLKRKKEPAPAPTETSSKENIVQVQNTTSKPESQALRGVEVIGLMQTMLIGIEENFGDNVEVVSLRADSEQAHIMFRYGGKDYVLSFGLAF